MSADDMQSLDDCKLRLTFVGPDLASAGSSAKKKRGLPRSLWERISTDKKLLILAIKLALNGLDFCVCRERAGNACVGFFAMHPARTMTPCEWQFSTPSVWFSRGTEMPRGISPDTECGDARGQVTPLRDQGVRLHFTFPQIPVYSYWLEERGDSRPLNGNVSTGRSDSGNCFKVARPSIESCKIECFETEVFFKI